MKFNWDILLTILASLCTVVAAFISYYMYIKKEVESRVPDAINGAEDTGMPGAQKFEEAVNTVYSIIPAVIKPFITRTLVETLVQEVFDKMEDYAEKQLDKKNSK